jgi:small subunit ribosomal protein S15
MLDKKAKQRIINKYKTHESDTGSTPVQIAILTEEIKQLTDHLKQHKLDHSSRRGLLKKVAERRKLLKYYQREDEVGFKDIAIKLKLNIAKKMVADDEEEKAREARFLAGEEEVVEEEVVEKTNNKDEE